MKKSWHRVAAAALAATLIASQGISAAAEPANQAAGASVEYLTLQPGTTQSSVNLNWYAPDGTTEALVKFGDQTVQAAVSELTAPTKLDTGKYTDTGKWYAPPR